MVDGNLCVLREILRKKQFCYKIQLHRYKGMPPTSMIDLIINKDLTGVSNIYIYIYSVAAETQKVAYFRSNPNWR